MTKTPQEILLGAAEIIQRDGWHQGDLYARPELVPDGDGITMLGWDSRYEARDKEASRTAPACAVGAVVRSAHGYARWLVDSVTTAAELKPCQDALKLLEQHIGATGTFACSGVPSWNDAKERTAEDVILALKHAAHITEVERVADDQ